MRGREKSVQKFGLGQISFWLNNGYLKADTDLIFNFSDAFKLYDLRHTGFIEREEVCKVYYKYLGETSSAYKYKSFKN